MLVLRNQYTRKTVYQVIAVVTRQLASWCTGGWQLATIILGTCNEVQGHFRGDGPFAQKIIQHVYAEIKNLGVADAMAAVRDEWWIPRLRTLVKKQIR